MYGTYTCPCQKRPIIFPIRLFIYITNGYIENV